MIGKVTKLDIYGRVNEFKGEQDFIPFRYQGQYLDEETGLYYNRFRYYSPNEGIYTQLDPIGLAGDNPTLYAYVSNTNNQVDIYGLRVVNNPLIPGEGKVGTYEYLIKEGVPKDNLTPHHMPSALYMSQNGVLHANGVTMNMEQPSPGVGGRHRATATYGERKKSPFNQTYLSLSPRDALAHDIRDARRIYQEGGKYTPEIRRGLQIQLHLTKSLIKKCLENLQNVKDDMKNGVRHEDRKNNKW
ncbi:RHS repeat-associated core domain-containing protein [Lysinibacillus sp. NPDC056959]|uniref:RHS repeat-associated core domain-containing protein n=1 Tax=Lysinibacillus sp. NPDC056959 TaxID=3345981 RepID=UPI003640A1C7